MKKVLVIEDNLDNLRLISYPLKRNGYEILTAHTGEEGIKIATEKYKEIDFIIMDINLPGINGIETTKKIKNMDKLKNIPIVAITSYVMIGDREKVMMAGCDGYLEKPIDPLTVMDEINKIIGSSGKTHT